MKSRYGKGDLVRNTFSGELGIIMGEAKVNGPYTVWLVLASGVLKKFQKFQMELVSEGVGK